MTKLLSLPLGVSLGHLLADSHIDGGIPSVKIQYATVLFYKTLLLFNILWGQTGNSFKENVQMQN